jgi:hypothetical protein
VIYLAAVLHEPVWQLFITVGSAAVVHFKQVLFVLIFIA